MKKYILRINDENVCVVYGDEYEFIDDSMVIFLEGFFVACFNVYIDGVSVIQSEVDDESYINNFAR